MKTLITLMSLALIFSFSFDADARRGQVLRTAHGVKNGSIDSQEAKKIGRKRRRARRVERRALKDGEVTQKEARRIRRAERRESRAIFKAKHDKE